jgi:S-adenosylmethionine:tRNA ribosyltransferase-isomerase
MRSPAFSRQPDRCFMRATEFDFELPEELIALRPASPRGSSRLLEVRPEEKEELRVRDRKLVDLPDLLRAGDVLVFNDTRVIHAALVGTRTRDGRPAAIHVNLHKKLGRATWKAFARPARRLRVGDEIVFGRGKNCCCLGALDATVKEKGEGGEVTLAFDLAGLDLDNAIAARGAMPLPPYISSRREPDERDNEDYQTIFAREDGAVAAPTAGLHFTPRLLERLEDKGIERHFLTLHVGAGTFLPVKSENIENHKMHAEWGEIGEKTATAINEARGRGGRIVAVGTTSLRLLESAVDENGSIKPFSGDTDIFITPGYSFRAADMLLTNFHLPRSTLFMLVSAFCGLDLMKRAYDHAIAAKYRFFSYGDACLLHKARESEAKKSGVKKSGAREAGTHG